METITMYRCNDGSTFNEKAEAEKYEMLCAECARIEGMLVSIGRNLNYDEYIQQDEQTVKSAFAQFMAVVAKAIPSYANMALQCGSLTRHISHIGRVIDDYGIRCLQRLYYRFYCIDFNNGREFQQPFFTNHQDEAKTRVN